MFRDCSRLCAKGVTSGSVQGTMWYQELDLGPLPAKTCAQPWTPSVWSMVKDVGAGGSVGGANGIA